MKIWLDDEREARQDWFPQQEGWVYCRWPEDVIRYLENHKNEPIEVLSLDHDLGQGNEYTHPKTGYDVILWLEQKCIEGGFTLKELPKIHFHTRNPEGRRRMQSGLRQIYKILGVNN